MAAQQAPARELFKEAFENRYTWDKDFPGYRAEITYFPKEGEPIRTKTPARNATRR